MKNLNPASVAGGACGVVLTLSASMMLSGCVYFGAAISPITVEAEKKVTSFEPEETHIEARSSESSHISGRNNLTFQAAITEASSDRVLIDGLLLSTVKPNTDPNNYYVYLSAGDQTTPVSRIGLGEAVNTPYDYQYTYTVEVEAGRVRFDDGTSATIYEEEQRTAHAQEDYFSRSVALEFEADEVIAPDAEEVTLEIRDLGVSMTLNWIVE